jgi:mono/diheme cytochrome c family protein
MSTMRAVQTRPAPSDGWRRWLPVALLGATLALGLWAVSPRAAMARPEESPPAELAAKAKTILETHCVRCHGVKDEVGTKMDVRKLATLTRGTDGGPGVVVPGDPAASYLMLRVDPKTAGENGGSMPPEGESPRPSEADVETLRAWIAAGAPSWGGAEPAPAAPAAPAPTLDQQAHAILKAHCAGCHGASRREKNLNFLEPRSFRRVLRGGALSPLVKRVTADAGAAERMPPAPRPALGAADQDVLRRWAAEERREDVVAARIEDVLRLVRDDLHALAREQREHMRYVSMLHDLADPDLSDEDRAASRAAVSKLLNSLSWSARVSVPRVLGTGRHLGLVLAVDTRTLDGRPPWGAAVYFRDVWDQVLASSDPYALRRESQYVADAAVGRLAEDIHDLSGDHNPVVRGDWLVARAGRSPLYYAALQLPPSVEQLERQLGADVSGGLSRAAEGHATDEVVRSGFRSSGVSRYNRIVERHALSRGGSYWKSFE